MSASAPAPDVVVIGGGIVGVATALQLQRTGRKVLVVERGEVGDEASGHNGGLFSGDCMPVGTPGVLRSLPTLLRDPESPLLIRKRFLPTLTPWLIRFALASLPSRVEDISRSLADIMSRGFDAYRPLLAGTDVESVVANRGYVSGYRDRKVFEGSADAFALRKRRGVAYEVVDAKRMAEFDPTFADRFEMGVYYPNAFFTKDPQAFTQSLLRSLVANGGATRQATVTGFATRAGRVERLLTSDGEIAAGAVVISAGPWSRALLNKLGTDVPLEVERGYGVDLPAPGVDVRFPVILEDFHIGLTPHRTGFRLSGIDELANISAPADMRIPERLIRAAKQVFPQLRTDGARPWMRRRPSLPDSLPVIGQAPRYENAYLNFGHAHKGLCQAAITGKLLQEFMDRQPTTVDIAPFAPTRFSLWPRAQAASPRTA